MSLLPKSVIGESNSDSHQKEFYDRRREAESSRDRGHDYAKDSDRSKDYGKEIGAAETTATQGVVAETLHRIAAATSRRELSITRSARRLRGTRRAVKTPRKDAANSLPRWKKKWKMKYNFHAGPTFVQPEICNI